MTYSYAGFLSYAHDDEAVAARLHKALETYKIPKGHSGELSPIFRDANELTAHHSLSEKIQGAVKGSRVLIVLCSPAAKASHWVNEEIRLFRKMHGEAAIFCVLADGTPQTAFPPALLDGGREPLAANLGTRKSSFQLGVTQIAAAMLGVGLDTLIQRDARRKRRRLQTVTAGALLFSGLMGATTISSVTARKAADTNRQQAEGLVEYMITDMKEKLEPVGRLDILDGIGQRAVEYYDAQDIAKLSDDSLARQARARHVLGQVAIAAYDFEKAHVETQAAARLTQEVYNRNPDDTDALLAHSQSEYWVGAVFAYEEDYVQARDYWESYRDMAEKLYKSNPEDFDILMERGWASNNMAFLNNRLGDLGAAKVDYLESERRFERALKFSTDEFVVRSEIANVWEGLAQLAIRDGDSASALSYRQKQVAIYQSHLDQNQNDYEVRFRAVQSRSKLLWDGVPHLSPAELEQNIDICFSEYDHLLNYEPSNEIWKKSYKNFIKFIVSRQGSERFRHLDDAEIEARLLKLKDL